MERILIQMELTVIAGDHESYKISTEFLIRAMNHMSDLGSVLKMYG